MSNYLQNNFDYQQLAAHYDELPFWSAAFGLALLDAITYRKGITALDIGFGCGFPLTELAMRLGAGSKVIGIDPWKEGIERSRKKIRYFEIGNIEIIEGVAEDIPLDEESVDLIVSNNGLNNVSDLHLVLRECSRVMRKGGQMVITLNLESTMHEFYRVFEQVLAGFGYTGSLLAMKQHIYEKRKPAEEWISMLEAHGFEPKKVKYDSFCYRFADGSAMLNHYFIRMAFMDAWKKIVPADTLEKVFGEVEKQLNEQAAETGGMQLSIPFVMIDSRKK